MKLIKCMNGCCCVLSLKLGAYLICCVYLVTSITIASVLTVETGRQEITPMLRGLLVFLSAAHILLFLSSFCLLYGLCSEKVWPLLAFIPATLVTVISEAAIVAYIIINRNFLPSEFIATAAGQSVILVVAIFSGMEVFSLYVQWQEDISEGRILSTATLEP